MNAKPKFEFGGFQIDLQERLLLRDGQKVSLRPQLLNLLISLVENGGHLLSKEELKSKA